MGEECEGNWGRIENQAGLRILATLAKILQNGVTL